jgi:hypothetical protein
LLAPIKRNRIPLIFSDDLGSRLQHPLVIVVIAGMSIGTLVSLYFVPLCYYYLIRKGKIRSKKHANKNQKTVHAQERRDLLKNETK